MKTEIENLVSSGFAQLKSALFWAAFSVLALGALWCSGAFFHAFDAPPAVAAVATLAAWGLLLASMFIRRAIWALAILVISAVAAFSCITPQQRFRSTVWQKPWRRTLEVRKLADGRYELRNVRDFRYRAEQDFDLVYRTVTVDPEQISSVDAVFSHWDDLEGIAHSMLALNFADGTTVVISLETRLPEGADQNAVDGFYRRYGLAMLAGTPEDLYGLRADHRGETLYVYRLNADRDFRRRTVRSLLERAEALQKHPEYYNSLVRNCTTGLLPMLPGANKLLGDDWRLTFNGLADKLLFDKNLLVRREKESFGSLRARSLVPGLCRGKGAPPAHYAGESEARWLRAR